MRLSRLCVLSCEVRTRGKCFFTSTSTVFRGQFADCLIERPLKDASTSYFPDPDAFIRRLFTLIQDSKQSLCITSPHSREESAFSQLTTETFACLAESLQLSSSVRALVLSDQRSRKELKELLVDSNNRLASFAAETVARLCEDQATLVHSLSSEITACTNLALSTPDLKTWLWDLSIELLGETINDPAICGPIYRVASRLVQSNKALTLDSNRLRSAISLFADLIWQVDLKEELNSRSVDPRISGLCQLIGECVFYLRGFKQPLLLG